MSTKRAHRRKLDDPLVPVSGDHVRAVLRLAKLSEREAVRTLKRRGIHTGQPTLDHIIHGRQVRCRKSLRNGIASLFGAPLPPEWLDGKHDCEIWGVARPGADLNLRARPDSPLGRAGRKLREQFGVPAPATFGPNPEGPPLYELIAYRLTENLRKVGVPDPLARQVVRPLLSLTLWQRWFFGDAAVGIIETEEMERFAAAAGEAISIALRPWLPGDASVHEGRLERVKSALGQVKEDVDAAARLQASDFLREFISKHPDGVSGAAAPPEPPLTFGLLVEGDAASPSEKRPRGRRPRQSQ